MRVQCITETGQAGVSQSESGEVVEQGGTYKSTISSMRMEVVVVTMAVRRLLGTNITKAIITTESQSLLCEGCKRSVC